MNANEMAMSYIDIIYLSMLNWTNVGPIQLFNVSMKAPYAAVGQICSCAACDKYLRRPLNLNSPLLPFISVQPAAVWPLHACRPADCTVMNCSYRGVNGHTFASVEVWKSLKFKVSENVRLIAELSTISGQSATISETQAGHLFCAECSQIKWIRSIWFTKQ